MARFNTIAAQAALAVCSTLSLVATASFFSYIAVNLLLAHRAGRRGDVELQAKINSRLRFLKSQFGILLLNLLAADLIQSLGSTSVWYWISIKRVEVGTGWCTSQAVFIQLGDTASGLWSLTMAAHTMAVLTTGRKPHRAVLGIAAGVVWGLVIFLAFIGPAAIQTKANGPFYGSAGAWCWISAPYDDERMWLHYLPVMLAAGGNIILYGYAIVALRHRIRGFADPTPTQGIISRIRRPSHGTASNHSRDARTAVTDPQVSAKAHVRHAARRMILYPVVYLIVVGPLTVVRLIQSGGHMPPPEAQVAGGCIFTLGGFVNTLLWGFTRGIFSLRRKPVDGASRGPISPVPPLVEKPFPFPSEATPVELVIAREVTTQVDAPGGASYWKQDPPYRIDTMRVRASSDLSSPDMASVVSFPDAIVPNSSRRPSTTSNRPSTSLPPYPAPTPTPEPPVTLAQLRVYAGVSPRPGQAY